MMDDEWWWCRSVALQSIRRSLVGSYVAVVDNFLPASEIHSVTNEICTAYQDGLLSKHGAVGTGELAIQDSSIRGDLYGFYGRNSDDQWKSGRGGAKGLERLLDKMNTIVCELRDLPLPGPSAHPPYDEALYSSSELRHINTRSSAMVTCYPGNSSYYKRHYDNAYGNGRKLTAIFYTNKRCDGGDLVIYPDYGGNTKAKSRGIEEANAPSTIFGYNNTTHSKGSIQILLQQSGSVCIQIAPTSNRLVLFWSDRRCPHEVLPTKVLRFAVTLWFIDSKEKARSMDDRSSSSSSSSSSCVNNNDAPDAVAGLSNQAKGPTKANSEGDSEPLVTEFSKAFHSLDVSNDCIEGKHGNSSNDICNIKECLSTTGVDDVSQTNTTSCSSISISRLSSRQPVVIHASSSPSSSLSTASSGIAVCHCNTTVKFQIRFPDNSSHNLAILDYDSMRSRLILSASDQSFDSIYLDLHHPYMKGDKCRVDQPMASYSKKKMVLTIQVTIHSTS